MRPFYEIHTLKRISSSFSCSFEYLDPASLSLFKPKYIELRHASRRKEAERRNIQKRFVTMRGKTKNPDGIIQEMYEIEYAMPNNSHYAFLNALLSTEGLEKLTGFPIDQLRQRQILDVGTGSGELIRFLLSQRVPPAHLGGTDIAHASIEAMENMGVRGYQGRLEDLSIPAHSIDLLFLSYFIDYDTNQKETLNSAIKLMRTGGTIVFEGLLPCIVGGGQTQRDHIERRITRGRSLGEDTTLICQAFVDQANNEKRTAKIEKIILSYRYIYNQLGLRKRRSVFIVAEIT